MTKQLVLNFDDSANDMKLHYRKEYPASQKDRSTFGNVPNNLHAEINELAKSRGLTITMTIAALYDFYLTYEAEHVAELKKVRAAAEAKIAKRRPTIE